MKKIIKPLLILLIILVGGLFLVKPIINKLSYGIDLQGGFEILYNIEPLEEGRTLTSEDITKTYDAIVKRIDTLGVSEPVITVEGDNLIRVQLPGVSNEDEARNRISTTAVLSFRDTDDKLLLTSEVLGRGGASLSQNERTLAYQIPDAVEAAGYSKATKALLDGKNMMVVWLDFDEKTDSYENQKNICGSKGNMKCISAAYVNQGLNSNNVVIEGSFTEEEAKTLVDLINSGSLPTKLTEESTPKSVSPSFGEETISKTGIAGLITLAIICLILIFNYKLSGVVGSICLFAYVVLVFAIFNAVGGVLTLTGIAALILGIGMAVDSIIISNERVKDELNKNSKLTASFKEANKNSLKSIVDSNITTLIAGIVLYLFGESSVKGFATMLIITILVTAITTVIVYRLILSMIVNSTVFKDKTNLLFGKYVNKKDRNYVKIAKYPMIVSLIIIILGISFVAFRGFNFGVDFTGGTNIVLSGQNDIDFDEVKKIVSNYEIGDYDYYLGNKKEGYIKINNILNEEEEIKIKTSLEKLNIKTSVSEISNLVTKSLTKNAIKALLYSLVAIIIYITIRFNFNYAITGILMLLHDVLIILAIFAVLHIKIDFIIVAALLTIIGYSINDTIVVFDRIRENRSKLYRNKKVLTEEELKSLVNTSSVQTINRNIWTSITTIVSVLTLIFIGLNDIFTFNIAVLIGLIAGTISSLLIGPRIWIFLERRSMLRPDDDDEDEVQELKIKGIND